MPTLSKDHLWAEIGRLLSGLYVAKRQREGPKFTKAFLSQSRLGQSAPYFGMLEKGRNAIGVGLLRRALVELDASPEQERRARMLLAASQVEDQDIRDEIAKLADAPHVRRLSPSRTRTAHALQPGDPDSLDPPQRRGDVHRELNRAWLQVMVAYDTRRENPDRWTALKVLLDGQVPQPEQERADISTRIRNRRP
jgi:hypothetical protein